MFTLNDMRALLDTKPFVPFRLFLSDGGHIDIRSKELVFPGRRFAIIGLLDPNTLDEGFDRYATVWYMHITRHEALTPGASPFSSPEEPPPGTAAPATGS